MTGGVSGYAAINARVRVMYSNLLSGSELDALSEAPDLASLVESLRHTVYGTSLGTLKEQELNSSAVVYALKSRMAATARSVIQAAPENSRPVLIQLHRRYEINNLKAVLRGLAIGVTGDAAVPLWDRVRSLLFPLGFSSKLPLEAMVHSGNVGTAVELLLGTAYYEVLSFAMKRYTAEQSLFPLEVALDLHYWRMLWQDVRKLQGQDQGPALRVVGALVDMNNLMWAIRYRVFQQISEEELINYTLPFGHRVRDEDIRSLAAGGDIMSIVTRLYPDINNLSTMLEEPKKGLSWLELELGRHVKRQCLATFVGNPFHIGIPLAYLVLHDLEIQDLIVLVEAKASQLPVDVYGALLTNGQAVRV